MRMNLTRVAIGLLATALLAGGCSGALDVTNPGPIEDSRLDVAEAVPSLVTGMSSDLSVVLDEIVRLTSIASDELAHGGSYTFEGLWYRGIIRPEEVNYEWSAMHRARVASESGIERMKTIAGFDYEKSRDAARANLLAGFANRMLGENVCQAVIDVGAPQDFKVHFARAEKYFTEALRLATAQNVAETKNAALAGRASVLAWQGKWNEAVADAAQVPATFVYNAVFSTNSSRENNSLVAETYNRREFTVFGTRWASVFGDPRVPWDTIKTASGAIQKGQDGRTNFFRQAKYPDLGSDIPLAKGTEMLMLRAEAALRAGDIAGAFARINEQRAVYRLPALPVPADIAAAWRTLQAERGAVLWLEARRLWDLRRWYDETGPAKNSFLEGRDKCIPISLDERTSNPNIPKG